MTHVTDAVERPDLVDALLTWRVDPRGQRDELLAAARRAHASAPGPASLGVLAGATGEESYAATRSMADAVAADLGLAALEGAALQDAAVAAMARRHLAGHLSARELTYWVTSVIGLRATARSRVFLTLEDEYVAYPWNTEQLAALEARVTHTAADFLQEPASGDVSRPGLVARVREWRRRRS